MIRNRYSVRYFLEYDGMDSIIVWFASRINTRNRLFLHVTGKNCLNTLPVI